jgi:O-antigen/teichoic acid export membrane protein
VQLATALLMRRRLEPDDPLVRPSLRSAWRMVAQAWPFALNSVVASAEARLAPLALGYLAGTAEVATFAAASRIDALVRTLPYAAFGAALPVLSREAAHGDASRVRRRFVAANGTFAIAAGLVMAGAAGSIVDLTYGNRFAGAAWPLAIAGVGLAPALTNAARRVSLFAIGGERTALAWSAVSLATKAAACLALAPAFGASGAMAAFAAGEALVWWPLRRAAAPPEEEPAGSGAAPRADPGPGVGRPVEPVGVPPAAAPGRPSIGLAPPV